MANLIQIKRSAVTDAPASGSLQPGELAYSLLDTSNSLFVGNSSNNAIRIGGGKYLWLHQANVSSPGALTVNAAVITNGNGYVTAWRTNNLIVGTDGATVNVTSISVAGNSTQLGASAGGSNNELVTSYAIKTYVDGVVSTSTPTVTSTQVGYGNSSNQLVSTANFTFTDGTSTISVGNTTVNTTVSPTAIVTGATIAAGNTTITGFITSTSTVNATALNIGDNVNFSTTQLNIGNTTVNTVITSTSINTDGTLDVLGATTLSNTLNVTGLTTLGTANVTSSVNIIGAATVNGALTVNNTAALGNTTITGFANVSSTLNVVDAATVNGTFTVNNTAAVGNTTITGFANVSSYINVVGAATVNGALTVNNIAAVGNTTITGFANVSSTLNVVGAATVNGALTVNNTAAVGNTTISGFANVTSTLQVGANASFAQNVSVTGHLSSGTLAAGDTTISGNLTITGTLTTVSANNLSVTDSLIQLASNNTTSDILDIGFFGSYESGDAGNHEHTGLFRDASDSGVYKLFQNLEPSPTTTVDTANTTFEFATLQAFLKAGGAGASGLIANSTTIALTANSTLNVAIVANTLTLSSALGGNSGGTGLSSVTAEDILVANSTNGYRALAKGAEGTVLQISSGVVAYTTLDGGTF